MYPIVEINKKILKKDKKVIVPEKIFKFLLTEYLKSLPFDEAAYLRANPDVDAAIHRGEQKTGKEHFIYIGFFEGRSLGGNDFDEKWYLRNNSDVADSVRRGEWKNGKDHWVTVGVQELRAPSKSLASLYAVWRDLLCE